MPKLKNRVPSYRRHKATGQAVVTVAGRDIYLGKYNTAASRAEYKRIIAEWTAHDGTAKSTGVLVAADQIADALGLDDELLDMLLAGLSS